MKKENGVTLVILVTTIIVMIILASVSISVVIGKNSIINKSKEVVEDKQNIAQDEQIKAKILACVLDHKKVYGEPLIDNIPENSSKWHTITIDEMVYGTGWNYIKIGTKIDDLIARNAYLVNTKTGKIIKLEDGKYEEKSH